MTARDTQRIQVRLLGGYEIQCEGKPVSFAANPASRMVQLLLLLLYQYPAPLNRSGLLDTLYGYSEVDRENSFKALLFRLRKAMAKEFSLPAEECLLLEKGWLKLSERLTVESDAASFKQLVRTAEKARGTESEKLRLEQAVTAYRGALLPALSTEPWVIFENAVLQESYADCVTRLAKLCRENKDYKGACAAYKQGLAIDAFREDWIIGRLDCLSEMGEYSLAMTEYEERMQQLFDEFGVYPSERLLDCMQRVNRKVVQEEKVSEGIFLEEESAAGAYYCTYPAFTAGYHILKRIMKRDKIVSSLVLLTVTSRKGEPLKDQADIVPAITALRLAVGENLRRNDMYTRYSRNQLLVLLWGTPGENTELVVDRIRASLEKKAGAAQFRIASRVMKDGEGLNGPDGRASYENKSWAAFRSDQ